MPWWNPWTALVRVVMPESPHSDATAVRRRWMDDEGEEGFLEEMRSYLRIKGFRLVDLALQDEVSHRAGGGLEDKVDQDLLIEVQRYLRRKGFYLTDLTLLEERCFPHGRAQEIYQGYEKLSALVNDSLYEYKHEVASILYPIFLQCSIELVERGQKNEAQRFYSAFVKDHELLHSEELYEIKRIFSAANSEEKSLVKCLKKKKFSVPLSEYSYDFLLQYLYKTKAHVILRMINERIIFEVNAGWPSPFPIGRQVMAEMIKTGSAAALVAISALNLIAANTERCFENQMAKAVISALPFTYIPFGLLSVTLSVAAEKDQQLVGYAAGGLLGQFIYLIFLGELRVLACQQNNFMWFCTAIAVYSSIVVMMWSFVCAYPKRVRSLRVRSFDLVLRLSKALAKASLSAWYRVFGCRTRERATLAVRADASGEQDLEAGAARPPVAMIGNQVNRATARNGVTATATLRPVRMGRE